VNKDIITNIIEGVLAALLIVVTAYLQLVGKDLDGFQTAVPVLVAFYFGHQAGVDRASITRQTASPAPSGVSGAIATSASGPTPLPQAPASGTGEASGTLPAQTAP